MTHDGARNGTLLSRHQKIMPPWVPLFYEEPLEIVRGDGCMVTDSRNKTYMEFYSGIATNTVGYGVPGIEEAVRERLRTGVVHTSTFYLIREQVELAERIADASGIPDPVVFFASSGTDAVETALLLATQYRGSQQVIALRYGYHGRSFGSLAVTGDRTWQGRGLSPLRVAYVHGGERRRGALARLGDEDYVRAQGPGGDPPDLHPRTHGSHDRRTGAGHRGRRPLGPRPTGRLPGGAAAVRHPADRR